MSSKKDKPPRPSPPDGSCHFFVERKNRYCRFHPTKEIHYCAEHATVVGATLERKRVTCPYDAKHTCFADKVTHHMNRCPSRPREMPAYYSTGVNSGDNAGEDVPDPKVSVLTVDIEELQIVIDKVNRLYAEYVDGIQTEVLTHSCLQQELSNQSYGTAALRHRRQQASLIGHMDKLGLLRDGICFLEMGAGKGQLSHWLHGAVQSCKDIDFVLVDRSHVRNKMDNLHKEDQDGHVMERIRMDIEHLKLGRVPVIESHQRPVVAFGKHLCGGATDLALRCTMETLSVATETNDEEDVPKKRLKSNDNSVAGAVIALCCHHRCTWTPYVGKSFFKSCGLTARDFQIISSMSSWATCAWKGWSHSRKAGSTAVPGEGGASRLVEENRDTANSDASGTLSQGDSDADGRVGSSDGKNVCKDENVDSKSVGGVTTVTEKVEGVTTVKEEVEDDHRPAENTINTRIKDKLSETERQVIGRKCKRLIDYGRIRYMNDLGMTSSLKVYIEEFYTPENIVLLAKS